MARNALTGWTVRRLRFALLGFFLVLAVPTALLITYTYSQLKWETFHRERLLAEGLVKRIDRSFADLIAKENARPFTDYSFLNVSAETRQLQRSPLSELSTVHAVEGTVGYFQIEPNGRMTTPILPADDSDQRLSAGLADIAMRTAQRDRMLDILSRNQVIAARTPATAINSLPSSRRPSPRSLAEDSEGRTDLANESTDRLGSAPIAATTRQTGRTEAVETEEVSALSQTPFEQLARKREPSSSKQLNQSFGRLEDLKLSKHYRPEPKAKETAQNEVPSKKDVVSLRKEQNVLPERATLILKDEAQENDKTAGVRVSMFESEIDAFEFSVLDSGHFVLFRKVWKDGQRLVQGILFEPNAFINSIIEPDFKEAAVFRSSNLTVAYEGNILSLLRGESERSYISSPSDIQGFLLLESRLTDPLSGLSLVFSLNQLPAGPGATVVNWLAVLIAVVLCSGFYFMYRLGVRHINIARQQQDFISAVSHELKTPLTSIRMYGEMLMQGWLEDDKRKQYYTFIHDESERLTRLINNVLQMAHMTRNELQLDIKPYTVEQLSDTIRSKVSSQVERSGFVLALECEQQIKSRSITLDIDCFIQIIINLADNAIKFSAKSENKRIDITCVRIGKKQIQWRVRDYGPGIPKQQMRKIFELFYRSENELTRETIGTGIGLALVTDLTQAMKGSIDVINRTPGAEFQLTFDSSA